MTMFYDNEDAGDYYGMNPLDEDDDDRPVALVCHECGFEFDTADGHECPECGSEDCSERGPKTVACSHCGAGASGEAHCQRCGARIHYDYDNLDDSPLADFAQPGGNSALRAASARNPRIFPCPDCETPDVLTAADKALGYCCDRCADRKERGGY
jgi:hypothetical protein